MRCAMPRWRVRMINDSETSRMSDSGKARLRDEPEQPLVVIVDDDAAVREALNELMLSAGMECACFESTQELLQTNVLERPGCLILDVRMPGTSGLDLQHHL